jgi:hypothetical protein
MNAAMVLLLLAVAAVQPGGGAGFHHSSPGIAGLDHACGGRFLFGIGMVNRTARSRTILTILFAWLITLPTATLLSAGTYAVLRSWQ